MSNVKSEKSSSEVLFVKSKVRDYIKRKDLHTANDVIDGDALNLRIMRLIDDAANRCIAAGRKTLQGKDL